MFLFLFYFVLIFLMVLDRFVESDDVESDDPDVSTLTQIFPPFLYSTLLDARLSPRLKGADVPPPLSSRRINLPLL